MKLPQAEIRKIVILRALQLGDMLCSVPAIRALHTAYPEASITLIGLPWAESFVKRFDEYIDRFLEFPGYPGLPEQEYDPEKVIAFIKNVQEEKFDLVLQMQGNGSYVNPLTELFNGKHLSGFYRVEDYCPNDLFIRYPNYGSEIQRHLLLMKHLGLGSSSPDLEFPLTTADFADFDQLALPVTENNYVCVHPGSRGAWRQWPPQHFAMLADLCYQLGFSIVLTGTEEEKLLTGKVQSLMKAPAINIAGKSSLGAMGVLLSKAALLISNCTGVSHMAAAFKTPSLVISMDGEPERWGPLNTSLHKTINWLASSDLQKVVAEASSLIKYIKQPGQPEARKTSRSYEVQQGSKE